MTTIRERLARRASTISLFIVGAWALMLYLHVMTLPFFRDDMVMLLWLQDMDWGRLWVDATGFLYYRPLSFSTLKLSELFFGYYHAPFLHAVNLFHHTANCVMLAMLTRRVMRRNGIASWLPTAAGMLAGMLFAASPFTYEVMPTTGPIFQLQAAFFGLAASLAYVKYRDARGQAEGGGRRWLLLTLAMAGMGAFTCEYGVIIPLMIALVEVLLWWRDGDSSRGARRSPDLRVPLACLAFTALYLGLWFTVPKARGDELPTLWLRELDLKGLFYWQGLTYPVQALAKPLERAIHPGAPLFTDVAALPNRWSWVIVGLGAAAFAALVGVYLWRRRGDVLLFGLALWSLAVLPTYLTLKWEYTWNGPRLLYLPAMGAAMLWGGALALLMTSRQSNRILFCGALPRAPHGTEGPVTPSESGGAAFGKGRKTRFFGVQGPTAPGGGSGAKPLKRERIPRRLLQVVGAAALALILAQNVSFLACTAEVMRAGGGMVDDTVAAIKALPEDESALVVNFPSWLRPLERTYYLGTEGISFLPAYSTAADLVELNGRAIRDARNLTFTNLWNPWRFEQRFYTTPVHWDDLLPAVRDADHVFLFRFDEAGAHLHEAGRVQATGEPASSFAATFGAHIRLDGAVHTLAGDRLGVALEWASLDPPGQDWTVFLHVYDEQGRWVAGADGDPLLGLFPVWAWAAGEYVDDLRYVDLPAGLSPGTYYVACGLYDRATGERVTPAGPDGESFADGAVPLFEFAYPGGE